MSFYIRAPKNTTRWYLWEKTFKEGKPTRKSVPEGTYHEFGFRSDMTAAEAKARASQLNKERTFDKRKFAQAARNEQQIQLVKSVFLPEDFCTRFELHLASTHLSSANNLNKLRIHWQTAQKIIRKLEVNPENFWATRKQIYKYFLDHKISLSYAKKLIRMLNNWGAFVSEQQGRDYQPIPNPRGAEAQRITDEHHGATGRRGESAPLSPTILQKIQEQLSRLPGQYEWMFVSLWFGLRPSEVDQLADRQKFQITRDPATGVEVLRVYQPKLVSVSHNKRWKLIPVFLEEQKVALEFIRKGTLKRPLTKTIKSYSGMDDLTLYGGRKAFTDMMLERNQKLEDIAMWLGHRDIDTTWKHYKQKDRVSFTKAS